MAWGPDVQLNGVTEHTLFIANDNDFLPIDPKNHDNPNQWFVFGVSDADIAAAVPDGSGSTGALFGGCSAGLLLFARRRPAVRGV
jgi:hypothetical protein